MAERRRSKDGSRDTDSLPSSEGSVDEAGRAGGRLAKEIGSKDEEKRALERPAGRTRVTKSVEQKPHPDKTPPEENG